MWYNAPMEKTLSDAELGWLAGFLDADGSIRLKRGWKNRKGVNSFVPHICFHNTCLTTLNHIGLQLQSVIPGFQSTLKQRKKVAHSQMGGIDILGMKRVEPLIRALFPYLVTKRLEAELLIKFIEKRQSGPSHNARYGMDEFLIYAALKEVKATRHLRDFVPAADEYLSQDKVRTAAKAVEKAEMTFRLSEEGTRENAKTLVWNRWDRSKVRPVRAPK